MKNLRRSRHCRRLFFRYLRQRDKEKQSEKERYKQNQTAPNEKSNPQFDKFNTAISSTIVVTIFLGIISIFIHYYLVIALFSALLLEIVIAIIGAIYCGNKERTQEKSEAEPTVTTNNTLNQTTEKAAPAQKLNTTIVLEEDNSTNLNSDNAETTAVLEPFDMLTGVQFKDLIEKYFNSKGYLVQRITPRINNIDFIVKKGEMVTAVATKITFDLIYRSYVKKVIESAKCYNTKNIKIITTSYFVLEAQQLAKEYGIMLWDREVLKSKLGGLK